MWLKGNALLDSEFHHAPLPSFLALPFFPSSYQSASTSAIIFPSPCAYSFLNHLLSLLSYLLLLSYSPTRIDIHSPQKRKAELQQKPQQTTTKTIYFLFIFPFPPSLSLSHKVCLPHSLPSPSLLLSNTHEVDSNGKD